MVQIRPVPNKRIRPNQPHAKLLTASLMLVTCAKKFSIFNSPVLLPERLMYYIVHLRRPYRVSPVNIFISKERGYYAHALVTYKVYHISILVCNRFCFYYFSLLLYISLSIISISSVFSVIMLILKLLWCW